MTIIKIKQRPDARCGRGDKVGGESGRTKNHDMSCTIQDVEFVTTFHPVILDRTTDPISYREEAILGGRWTCIGRPRLSVSFCDVESCAECFAIPGRVCLAEDGQTRRLPSLGWVKSSKARAWVTRLSDAEGCLVGRLGWVPCCRDEDRSYCCCDRASL